MKHIAKALVLASAFAAAGAAQAVTATVTLYTGDTAGVDGYEMSNLHGGGSLEFSDLLVGALNIANISTAAVSPSVLTDADVMSVSAPIQSLTGSFNTDTAMFTATKVGTLGGATMTALGKLPSGKNNAATTGGSLSLTNIKVDLTTSSIYATLTGANGVGTRNNQLIWNYGAIEGATTFAAVQGTTHAVNKLSQLTITTEAFDLFAQSLGLTAFGKSSMAGITDYGVMNATIDVDVKTPVPEPTTYMMMGLGLVGLAFASKRARRA
ncbi:MAG: PEP-CTERM sorting domain-containing protein [Aquabacterium sp.]